MLMYSAIGEEGEAHAAVLGVVAGDELRARPRAGRTARRLVSAIAGDEEDQEADELRARCTRPCRLLLSTMSTSESDCAIITTPITDRPSETSYETSCAHVRSAPSREYLFSLAQPPRIRP